ncbi:MAG: hypothetical protein H6641_03385 [Caldilineaceae bacterium]|nr:hypothetical protein [Caldilineaceae bacterium]
MAKRAAKNAAQKPQGRVAEDPPARPPLRPAGVLFALLMNLILLTLLSLLATTLGWPRNALLTSAIVVALAVGGLTARYVGARAGIHAFLGGMLSIPLLGWIAFGGDWQIAFFGGAFCALGGILVEKFSEKG